MATLYEGAPSAWDAIYRMAGVTLPDSGFNQANYLTYDPSNTTQPLYRTPEQQTAFDQFKQQIINPQPSSFYQPQQQLLPSPPKLPGVTTPAISLPDLNFSMPTIAPIQVPQSGELDLSKVPSFLSQIQALAPQQIDLLNQGLLPLFEQQRKESLENLAARGLADAGPGTETQRRLAAEQGNVLARGVGEILVNNQSMQVAELQRQRDIAEQERMFDRQANLEAEIVRYQTQTEAALRVQSNKLQAAGLQLDAQRINLMADELRNNTIYNEYQMELTRFRSILDANNQLTADRELDLKELSVFLDTFIKMGSATKDEDAQAQIFANADKALQELANDLGFGDNYSLSGIYGSASNINTGSGGPTIASTSPGITGSGTIYDPYVGNVYGG